MILVTQDEYYTIAFVMAQMGMFYTMHQMFLPPHERDENDEF
jgi:hypothetical protein